MPAVELSRETVIAKLVIEYLHTLRRLNERPVELAKWDKAKLVCHFKGLGLVDDLYIPASKVRAMSKQRIIELIVEQEIDELDIVERLSEMEVDIEALAPLLKLYMPNLT